MVPHRDSPGTHLPAPTSKSFSRNVLQAPAVEGRIRSISLPAAGDRDYDRGSASGAVRRRRAGNAVELMPFLDLFNPIWAPFSETPLPFDLILRLVLSLLIGWRATHYHRSFLGWAMLAFIVGPLVTFVLLPVAGVPGDHALRRAREESVRERHPQASDARVRALAASETECPHCRSPINPITGEGLRHSEKEPWALLCAHCDAPIQVTP